MEHAGCAADDGALRNSGTLNVVAQKRDKKVLELKNMVAEDGSSMPLSSSQLIQSHPFQTLPRMSSPGIGLHRINQSSASHPFAALSVFQGSLKQMQAIVRGNVCRRRLFCNTIDSDEKAMEPVLVSAKRARIEDYVDSFLLAEAAHKIRFLCQQDLLHNNSLQLVRGSNSFDWPSAELRAMTTSNSTNCYSLTTQQELQTNDDLECKKYSDVCNEPRTALLQQDFDSQKNNVLRKGCDQPV